MCMFRSNNRAQMPRCTTIEPRCFDGTAIAKQSQPGPMAHGPVFTGGARPGPGPAPAPARPWSGPGPAPVRPRSGPGPPCPPLLLFVVCSLFIVCCLFIVHCLLFVCCLLFPCPALPCPFVVCLLFVHCLLYIVIIKPPAPAGGLIITSPIIGYWLLAIRTLWTGSEPVWTSSSRH